jgi:ribose transport system permease protein
MSTPAADTQRVSVLPVPRSLFLLWLNIGLTVIVALIGFGLGFAQGIAAQLVILYTLITAAVFLWLANAIAVVFEHRFGARGDAEMQEEADARRRPGFWRRNRWMLLSMAALLLLYLIITATVPAFRQLTNLIAFLLLELILLFAFKVSGFFPRARSAFIGLMVLAALIVISIFSIEGFLTAANIRAILLFAAFLGIACIGQTMVALLGGLDLSIPFIIGAANIGLMFLISLGVPPWVATLFILLLGALVGLLNGLLSYRLQGQALILTLGMGFAVAGLTQIITSIGSQQAGNVMGRVPEWLRNLAAMNGETFGLAVPPTIVIWIGLSILIILALHFTAYGRNLYALGGNRTSARLVGVSELRYWTLAYTISGFFSAMTGCLLLGWSGGGFIDVGERYLFQTLAAVVIGGTSLAGGLGGYGFTVIGVLVLQLLSTLLVGIGLQYEWQQFIFGLLILPMVALYSRAPPIRAQV